MELNIEEESLIESIAGERNRISRRAAINRLLRFKAVCGDDSEASDTAESCARKLGAMTDEEYSNYYFSEV